MPFKAHYVLDRRPGFDPKTKKPNPGEVLVHAMNRIDYIDSVRFIKLHDKELSPKDLKIAAEMEQEAKKNPPLTGRAKRQARLSGARERAEAKRAANAPPVREGITEFIPEAEPAAAPPTEEKKVVKKAAKKKAVSAKEREEARKRRDERRAEARAASVAAEKAAQEAESKE